MVEKQLPASTPWMGEQAHFEGPRIRRVPTSSQSSSAQANLPSFQQTRSKRNPLSVHVTQLSYDATREQIAAYFEAAGCSVKSCRLVVQGGKSKGVAFVDLDDQASMNKGMRLHRTMFMGRRVNVRKTLAPEELQKIVEAREKKLADGFLGGRSGDGGEKKRKRDGAKLAARKKKKEKVKKQGEAKVDGNGRKKKKKSKKLTKSDRARKAAIIRSRK